MKNKITSLTLEPDVVVMLAEIQKMEKRSMANVINVAVKHYYNYLKLSQSYREAIKGEGPAHIQV